MRVVMISTPMCSKCKKMKPIIEEYCNTHKIEFSDYVVPEVPEDIIALLLSKGISTAPTFLVYRDEKVEPVVVSGDDVYLELG